MLYSMLKKFAYKGNIGSDGFILYMRSELHDLFIPANQTKEPMSTDDKQWQYLQWDPKWMTINYSEITNFGAFCEQCNKHTTFKQLFHLLKWYYDQVFTP